MSVGQRNSPLGIGRAVGRGACTWNPPTPASAGGGSGDSTTAISAVWRLAGHPKRRAGDAR